MLNLQHCGHILDFLVSFCPSILVTFLFWRCHTCCVSPHGNDGEKKKKKTFCLNISIQSAEEHKDQFAQYMMLFLCIEQLISQLLHCHRAVFECTVFCMCKL